MSLTPSNMLPLGTKAPTFELPDTVTGKQVALTDLATGKALVVMFICNHCPYVKHVQSELVHLAKDYSSKEIKFVAISSNDVGNYPQDSPERMREEAQQWGYSFPYLYDESQEVAKAYQAACTPDFYIFDQELALVYRGQLDDSRPGNGQPLDGKDIRKALDHILGGEPVSEHQIPSVGCNIKWK
ncbi:MAG: thioredoxin family protein [Cyclobacteriaceae bacterium]